MTARPGLLFVVSGPSGVGKDTLLDQLRAGDPALAYSVSATTRKPRPGEIDGKHYFFLTREEFEKRRAGGGLLEWREYNGNLYGTPRDYVERTLADGHDLIVKPEVNGALAIKRAYPAAFLIFVRPDSLESLEARLVARGTDTKEEIVRRLEIAQREIESASQFDATVVNRQGEMNSAFQELRKVMESQRKPSDSTETL